MRTHAVDEGGPETGVRAPEAALPVARYRFALQAKRDARLPDFAGSMLRGAFGRALFESVCPFERAECATCPQVARCPYPALFRPVRVDTAGREHQVPVPYGIWPDWKPQGHYARGAKLGFDLTLYGRARNAEPLVLDVVARMAANGLTRGRHPFSLVEALRLESLPVPRPADPGGAWKVELRTPLRLSVQGDLVGPRELDGPTFAKAAVRRCLELIELYGLHSISAEDEREALEASSQVRIADARVEWKDWVCDCSRLNSKLLMGGLLGSFRLTDVSGGLRRWLLLAAQVGIGKGTSKGMGRIGLDWEGVQ